MKFLLLSVTLFASLAFAKSSALNTPQEIVLKYHQAINDGDISTLKEVTVAETFDTDMEVYSLSIAMKDKRFTKIRKAYDSSKKARQEVISAVGKKLKNRQSRKINKLKLISLGKDRAMVRFLEDNKQKQLYLSLEEDGWKINYLAGRKTN